MAADTQATRPEQRPEQRHQALAAFLAREVFADCDALEIRELVRPSGGTSWETFLLTLALRRQGRAKTQRVAIKRAPADGPLAPYRVTKDVAIFSALATSDVPVPQLLAWTEDPAVFVRPFSVTSFVEGDSHDLSKVERWSVWQRDREALGFEMIDTLAALQRFRWHGTGLEEALGPRGCSQQRAAALVDRYLEPLIEAAESQGVGVPLWRDMGAWLKAHAPRVPEEELVVVHGDYRFGNLLWQDTRLAAVLDWERATLGPAMQDLGFMCMPLSRRKAPDIMAKTLPLESLAKRYEAASGRAFDLSMVQYYAVLWQFIEGVNTSRGMLSIAGGGTVASGGLVQANLVARQTLPLMEDFEAGRSRL